LSAENFEFRINIYKDGDFFAFNIYFFYSYLIKIPS